MEKEEKKAEWKQQYQKRKGYFKEYYQKHKDVMDANNKKNAKKYREEYKQLKEENKKLKSDLAFERTMLDNVRAEYKSSQEVIKKLKEKIERWEKCFKKGFNPQDVEYLMEEDTLQELRDLGKI